MIDELTLSRLFRLRLTNEDKSELYFQLSKEDTNKEKLTEYQSKLGKLVSNLFREYVGEEKMEDYRKIIRVSKSTNEIILCIDDSCSSVPKVLPDSSVKIEWYDNYMSKKLAGWANVHKINRPVITLTLDETFPSCVRDKNGELRNLNRYTRLNVEDFNINENTQKIIDEIYYNYLQYFKSYFISCNFLLDVLGCYCNGPYSFLKNLNTWKDLYNFKKSWFEILYDHYTIGEGYSDNVRFRYIEKNSEDKIKDLIDYVLS